MISVADKLLVDLKDPQREAVIHRGSPLLIIAGPGSGKTEVLARRVAHIILSGNAEIENILVTTFSKNSALELKDRIQQKLPEANLELMQVSTIHSFCYDLLRQYRAIAGDLRVLTEQDQFVLIYANREYLGLDIIPKCEPYEFFKSVVEAFNLATEELVEYSKLRSWCEETRSTCSSDQSDLWAEKIIVIEAYERYLKLLKDKNLIDFALLQRRALDLLQDKKVLSSLQNKYKYIFVDEYQDTNAVQDKILSLLAGKGSHLTVVGDDDQSIYRFRGATIKNILSFEDHYPKSKKILLEHNFRSRFPIIKNSQQVMSLSRNYK